MTGTGSRHDAWSSWAGGGERGGGGCWDGGGTVGHRLVEGGGVHGGLLGEERLRDAQRRPLHPRHTPRRQNSHVTSRKSSLGPRKACRHRRAVRPRRRHGREPYELLREL